MSLEIEGGVWPSTLGHLRSCGRGRSECVVYWLGAAGGQKVTEATHPVHTATPRHYEVDRLWFRDLSLRLARERLSILCQVHTHGGRAFHSKTDDEGAASYLPGMLSLVLPGWALADDCLRGAYLAELRPDGRWAEVKIAERLRL